MTAAASNSTSRLSDAIAIVKREPGLALGGVLSGIVLLVALLPWLFTSLSPISIDISAAMQPPSAAHWFGTDDTGRDIYARVIYGARVTLGLVAGSLALSALVGGLAGLAAGFFKRGLDMLAGRAVDVILSFPPIILGVMITGILGPGTVNLVLALSVVHLPVFFRIARSGAMAEAQRNYVEAARSLGYSETRILVRHVLRNVLPLVIVQYMIMFPLALQIQAALGFLGLGVQPPTPDWGGILEQGKNFLLVAPWMSVFPGLFILISALAIILVGRSAQRAIDQR